MTTYRITASLDYEVEAADENGAADAVTEYLGRDFTEVSVADVFLTIREATS